MMEAVCSSKTLVPTRATWCKILEDGILHSDCCENLFLFDFGKKFPDEKESVGWCVVMLQPALLSQNFGAKSLHIFTQLP
jgi:hypothetical protein